MPAPEIIIIPAVFAIPAAVIVIRMWFRHKETMASVQRPDIRAVESTEVHQRLARVEDALDAIAVEMERVGEGQRFLTKVLGERLPAPRDDGGIRQGKTTTPH